MPDDPSSLLSPIRAEALGSIAYADGHACPDIENSCSAHHALRLLAAIEALSSALRSHRHTFTERGTEICGGCLRPECPDSPEAIIAGALGGKGTTDE
jgi:hypothetical protein